MICPNCRLALADAAPECPGCGLDFAKWRARAERQIRTAWGTSKPAGPPVTAASMLAVNVMLGIAAVALAGGAAWGAKAYIQNRKDVVAAAAAAKAAAAEAKRAADEESAQRHAQETAFASAMAAAQPKARPELRAEPAPANKMTPAQEAMWRYGIAVSQENQRRLIINSNRQGTGSR